MMRDEAVRVRAGGLAAALAQDCGWPMVAGHTLEITELCYAVW